MAKRQYYDIVTQIYQAPQKIDIDRECNSINVKNAGTTLVFVDQNPLVPGESLAIGGNENEVLYGRHEVTFGPNPNIVAFPLPQFNLAVIVQKFFIEGPPNKC